jgi:MFS family permease
VQAGDGDLKRRLPRTVIILGLVSFFNDLASEMVVPLIPIVLATVLGAGPVILGLVEGIADAVASFLKLWSGRHSDLLGGKRKGLTLLGYLLSNVARPLLGVAGSWPVVLVLRSIDRVGKGLRSAPRDALVADSTPAEIRGFAYGFHRALDNAGAVGGSLVAAAALAWFGLSLDHVILWSAVPGMLGVLLIALGIREKARPVSSLHSSVARNQVSSQSWSQLPLGMRHYLMVLTLFTFARASETFIILRGNELGMSVVHLLLLWAVLNLAKVVTSTRGGVLSDAVGKGRVILLGWFALALSFVLLGRVTDTAWLWPVVVAYGLTTGVTEGPERALISDFSGPESRGTAFGWYHLMTGLAAIPAGLVFGGIWHYLGALWAFSYAGLVGVLSAALVVRWVKPTGAH